MKKSQKYFGFVSGKIGFKINFYSIFIYFKNITLKRTHANAQNNYHRLYYKFKKSYYLYL